MFVARGKQHRAFRSRQFVRRPIPTAGFNKSQWTIVRDQMFAKKVFGRAESFREQFPQTLTTDLIPLARETGHAPLWMLVRRTANFCFDAEPVAYGRDLAERDAGLHHAERAGIHAEKQDAFTTVRVTLQIRLMRSPGVFERVVNVRDRRSEAEFVHCRAQTLSGANQRTAGRRFAHGYDREAMICATKIAGAIPRKRTAAARTAIVAYCSKSKLEDGMRNDCSAANRSTKIALRTIR